MPKDRRILPPLDHLLAFDVAARHESFAAAARSLHVSETAVSRKIRLLEQHYACALFLRGNRSVQLTEQGRKLLNGVRPALAALTRVSEDMLSGQHPETVRVAATHSVSALWLMPRLPRFRKANPNIVINLVSSDHDAECLSQDFDLTILRGEGQWPGFAAFRLFGERVFPVCSPGYLAQNPGVADLRTLPDHALIEVDSAHVEWLNWKSWLARKAASATASAGDIRIATRVNTYPLAVQAAVDGVGVALGWSHLVDAHLQTGALVCPLGHVHLRTGSGYYLLQRDDAGRRPARDAVARWLVRESAARAARAAPAVAARPGPASAAPDADHPA